MRLSGWFFTVRAQIPKPSRKLSRYAVNRRNNAVVQLAPQVWVFLYDDPVFGIQPVEHEDKATLITVPENIQGRVITLISEVIP